MATYQIEIDDKAICDQITAILDLQVKRSLQTRYTGAGAEISAAVKDLIYSRKDEIVEMVVDRATREIVKKGLPKLLERMDG